MSLPVRPLPPSTLRLFDASQADSSEFKLRAAYQKYVLPELDDDAPATLREYDRALKHWESRTSNPDVRATADEDAHKLKASLKESGLRPATICKIWRHLRPIFRALVREGIIARLPRFKPPKVELDDPTHLTNRQLSALYGACDVVRITQGDARHLHGPSLFRAALVMFYNVGPRRDDLWDLATTAINLDRGSATWRVKKTGRLITRPLNATVVAHLRLIFDPAREKLFPLSRSTVIRWWNRVRAKAKLPQVTFHDFRRTCQTRFDELCDGTGNYMLDHRGSDVASRYYRNLKRKAWWIAKRKLKQPRAFLRVKGDPQLRLTFE